MADRKPEPDSYLGRDEWMNRRQMDVGSVAGGGPDGNPELPDSQEMHIAKYSLLLTVLKGRSFRSIFANHEITANRTNRANNECSKPITKTVLKGQRESRGIKDLPESQIY